MKKIAVYGGTFNPIHNGHIIALQSLIDSKLFDEVQVLPAGIPPFKEEVAKNLSHRLKMCQLICDLIPQLTLNKIEANREIESYTYDTLILLKEINTDTKYYWCIGFDNVFSIETWYKGENLLHEFDFVIMNRSGYNQIESEKQISYLEQRYNKAFTKVTMPNVEISSTMIRERVNMGQSLVGFVPENIIQYIQQQNIYS